MTPDDPVPALVQRLRELAEAWKQATDLLEEQAVRIQQLEAAIRWALGEEGDFSEEPPPLAGKYRQRFWWRTELRRRAALSPRQEPTP